MKYTLLRNAKRDLAGIWVYIADDSIDAADLWTGKLRRAVDLIVSAPGIGPTRRVFTKQDLLFWPAGTYLIVYRVQRRLVQVVAVLHGARDIRKLLLGRGQG